MNRLLAAIKARMPGASIWHVRGHFRPYTTGRAEHSINSFYVVSRKGEEIILFTTKAAGKGTMSHAGIVLSRYASLIEAEMAKRVKPAGDWQLLVSALPKETNQRLLAFCECEDEAACLQVVETAQIMRKNFLAGIRKIVTQFAGDGE